MLYYQGIFQVHWLCHHSVVSERVVRQSQIQLLGTGMRIFSQWFKIRLSSIVKTYKINHHAVLLRDLFWFSNSAPGFVRSLKVCGKWDNRFKAGGLWKFVNFVVFIALGKSYQLISQKQHFTRLNSGFKQKNCKITKNALPTSFDW